MSTITHIHRDAPAGSPGPGALMGDPVAAALWAAVMQLDAAWQHEFLERLRTYLAVPELAGGNKLVRVVALVSAVREAHALRREELASGPGYDPSVRVSLDEENYDRLRKLHRECGWPPPSTLRRWVQGGWNDVLKRARLEAVPGGDVLVDSRGRRELTWEEVSTTVRQYRDWRAARGYEKPEESGMHDLITWAELPDVRSLPGRRPASQSAFDRLGGFPTVKVAALNNEPKAPRASDMRPTTRAGSVRPRSGFNLPDGVLHAAIHVVRDAIGRVPRSGEYTRERERLLDEADVNGDPLPLIPSYQAINSRYGAWDAALAAAGLPPFGPLDLDPATKRAKAAIGPRNHITDEEVLAAIAEAYEALGDPFSMGAYRAWADKHGRVSPTTGRRLPTYSCIYQRYRDQGASPWTTARAAAGVPA